MAAVSPPISPVERRSVSPNSRAKKGWLRREKDMENLSEGRLWRKSPEVDLEAAYHVRRKHRGRCRSSSPVVSKPVEEPQSKPKEEQDLTDFLEKVKRRYGTLQNAFQAGDVNMNHTLSRAEFNIIVRETGFKGDALGLWRHLDQSDSGTISIQEFMKAKEEKDEKVERAKSQDPSKVIYEGVVKVEFDNGSDEARYGVLTHDALKLWISKDTYKANPLELPPAKKGAGVFYMGDLMQHGIVGQIYIRLSFKNIIAKFMVADKSARVFMCELISQSRNVSAKSRPTRDQASHKDAVNWLAQTLQWEPDDKPALRMPWPRHEQEDPLLFSRIASKGKEPIIHGGIGVDHFGKMNVRYASLFPDCLDVWERPKDAVACKKPFLHIPLTEVRSVVACGSGFVLSFKGRKIGFHMSRDEDMTKWTRAMLDVLGSIGNNGDANRAQKSVRYWDC